MPSPFVRLVFANLRRPMIRARTDDNPIRFLLQRAGKFREVRVTMEWVIRFLVGGLMVAGFSAIGDVLKPKSFAGLFGGAPSVALATLLLTVSKHGHEYAAMEGRSMIAGAAGFFVYAFVVSWLMMRNRVETYVVTSGSMVVWFAIAFGLWAVWLR